MEWFRQYNETIHDTKLRRLPPAQRWLWIALLTIASESPKRGYLLVSGNVPATFRDFQDAANICPEDVEAGFREFVQMEMIAQDGDAWYVVNWDKRQHSSDCSTERVRRYRSRNVADTTFPDASGNVSETGRKRTRVQIQSTDTEPPYSPPVGLPDASGPGGPMCEPSGQESTPEPETTPGEDAVASPETPIADSAAAAVKPAKGSSGGRRSRALLRIDDHPAEADLYRAYRRARYPDGPPDGSISEFTDGLSWLMQMVADQRTPDQIECATRQAARQWGRGYQVTIKAIAGKVDHLLESAGQGDLAATSAAQRNGHGNPTIPEIGELPPGVTLAKIVNAALAAARHPEDGRTVTGEGQGAGMTTDRPLAGRHCKADGCYYPLAWEPGGSRDGGEAAVDVQPIPCRPNSALDVPAWKADFELMQRADIRERIRIAKRAEQESGHGGGSASSARTVAAGVAGGYRT